MKIFDDQYIVVTGGAGFIGSGVIRHLNNLGIGNIIVVDELGHDDRWRNLVGKRFLDIIHKDKLFEWLEGRESAIEAFIHLGACSSTVEKNADFLLENNYRYSVRLAEYALKNAHRFIYASSAATYGDGSSGFNDDLDMLENLSPLNMYGYSKHLFDLWVKNEGVQDQVVGLKYFNVFGPNEGHKGRMASALVHFLPTAMEGKPIRLFKSNEPEVYEDGGQKRDFIYVKDAARMTCAFLEKDAGGIYNIGTGKASTWLELAKALFSALRQEPQIEFIDMPEDLIGKYQNYTCADMRNTRAVLGDDAVCAPLEKCVVDYVRKHLLLDKRW